MNVRLAAAVQYNVPLAQPGRGREVKPVLDVRSWGWARWLLFGLGCLALASYYQLISLGTVEQVLDRLAGSPEQMRGIFTEGLERAEALILMFAFLLLTPVVAFFGLFLFLFATAVISTFLHRMVNVPEAPASIVAWIGLAVVAFFTFDQWWPGATFLVALLARAFLVALRGTL
jgi:hypothetical protein